MAYPDREIWAEMLAHLRAHHPGVCRHWFDEIEPVAMGAGIIELKMPHPVRRAYLARECTPPFNEAAQAVTGRLVAVKFRADTPPPPAINGAVASGTASHGAPTNGHHPAPAQPRTPSLNGASVRPFDELPISPDYTFENFVVGPNNRLAHAASVATADNPGLAYNPLFIHGGVGLGKTHLLQAICQQVQEQTPDALILYINCEGFISRFMEAVKAGEMSAFRHQFREVDLLVIDDIHFLTKLDRTQDEFFHTFNSLYQAKRQIVLSSDAPPENIPDLEERLTSRFKWGLVAQIDTPEFETRVEIVRNKAAVRGVSITDEVARFIAQRVDTNIRELEGALTQVQMHAHLEGQPANLAIARAALGEPRATGITQRLTIESIVDAVTDYYDVTLAHLQSKKRHRSIALPRQVCMYLARNNTRYSLGEIGGYFGGRDHSTVLHAVRTVAQARTLDADLDAALKSLEGELLA